MRRIRLEKKVLPRERRDRNEVLPLDPRDPDIVRAKERLYGLRRVRGAE